MLKRALAFFNTCANPNCRHTRMSGKLLYSGVSLAGDYFCSPDCIHDGLALEFQQLIRRRQRVAKRPHRVPLGLLLMSRGEIQEDTLKAALREQRRSPTTRIGQILLRVGAVTEDQITSAVASQWSVPVFRLDPRRVPEAAQLVPFAFLERYKMLPVHFIQQRRHLHLAFAENIDRTLTYAIEQMLGVTTESCVAGESCLTHLIALAAQQQRSPEYVLNSVPEPELAGIVRGYAVRLRAEEIQTACCNDQIWVRATAGSTTTHFLFGIAKEEMAPSI